jgi:hypothetical protein
MNGIVQEAFGCTVIPNIHKWDVPQSRMGLTNQGIRDSPMFVTHLWDYGKSQESGIA